MAGRAAGRDAGRRGGQAGARKRRFPKPRDLPIDTFVVLMMENRSFDHYFGWHPKADAQQRRAHLPEPRRHPDLRDPPPDPRLPGLRLPRSRPRLERRPPPVQPAARWTASTPATRRATASDEFALGYYLKEDLGFIPHAADAFTLYDRCFCSIMASTYPNRHYQLAAQNGGQKSNELPAADRAGRPASQWETILDRALRPAGSSVAYYVSDLPFPALYGQRGLAWVRPASQFYTDAAGGTLPPICFVDPPFRDGGGGDGLSADEHPHGDVRLGQAFMSDVAHAFIESPQYRRGALFINYDEWGGFFDHVRPRHVPDDRANRKDLEEDWSLTGFRIPAVAISPYARAQKGGRVSHMTCTHESILKLISYRYGLGHLNKRHRYASNIGRSFNFSKRDFEPPAAARPGGDRRDAVLGRRQRARPQGARPGRARDLGPARPARLRGPEGHLRVAVPLPRQGPQRVRVRASRGRERKRAPNGALGSERTYRQRIPPLARRSFKSYGALSTTPVIPLTPPSANRFAKRAERSGKLKEIAGAAGAGFDPHVLAHLADQRDAEMKARRIGVGRHPDPLVADHEDELAPDHRAADGDVPGPAVAVGVQDGVADSLADGDLDVGLVGARIAVPAGPPHGGPRRRCRALPGARGPGSRAEPAHTLLPRKGKRTPPCRLGEISQARRAGTSRSGRPSSARIPARLLAQSDQLQAPAVTTESARRLDQDPQAARVDERAARHVDRDTLPVAFDRLEERLSQRLDCPEVELSVERQHELAVTPFSPCDLHSRAPC